MKFIKLLAAGSLLALASCATVTGDAGDSSATEVAKTRADTLSKVLAAQPEDARARYSARNPAQTLTFFGINPGMTVAEALPGGGWYTKILIPFIGEEGEVVGAHYPDTLWTQFGWDAERVQARIDSANSWVASTTDWEVTGAAISDYKLTTASSERDGTLDAVLFIRALHNLNRFGFAEKAVAESYRLLKPGGIVGVVQHRGPEGNPDAWADGSKGYLKQSAVIAAFEAVGFELVETSEINANPSDVPTTEDFVWRLPPTLAGSDEGTPERAAREAIGESDRMTLKFRKPG